MFFYQIEFGLMCTSWMSQKSDENICNIDFPSQGINLDFVGHPIFDVIGYFVGTLISFQH